MEKRGIEEASHDCGVPREVIISFIQAEWIVPVDRNGVLFDEEDIARIKLIWELKHDFGVNDDSMSIILHLLDQINRLHLEFLKYRVH